MVKKAILLLMLLCVILFSVSCAAPYSDGNFEDDTKTETEQIDEILSEHNR